MNIGIVPTKYGYNAVAIPPYDGKWTIWTPTGPLDKDIQYILKSEILRKLAIYCHMMSGWTGQLKNALPWALWGGFVLWLRLSNYASIGGWKMILLYGWIMFLFFGDGLWSLGRWINQVPNLIRVQKIRSIKDIDITIIPWEHAPTWNNVDTTLSERECIDAMRSQYEAYGEYYDEMLRREPPLVFSLWPLGMLGYVRYLINGPRIPRPAVIVELGRLS